MKRNTFKYKLRILLIRKFQLTSKSGSDCDDPIAHGLDPALYGPNAPICVSPSKELNGEVRISTILKILFYINLPAYPYYFTFYQSGRKSFVRTRIELCFILTFKLITLEDITDHSIIGSTHFIIFFQRNSPNYE